MRSRAPYARVVSFDDYDIGKTYGTMDVVSHPTERGIPVTHIPGI